MITLEQISIFLAAAVLFVSLFRWFKLSSILGFVAAGLVIGPWGLGLVSEVENILKASEFGVVLLLFIIGLELQPSRLWVLRRAVFGVGSAQVVLCTALLALAAWLCGVTPIAAGIVAFGLSLSSTALVLQMLAERAQLKTQHGRAAFGILLFQDLAVLPMLAMLPLVGASTQPVGVFAHVLIIFKLLAAIGAVILIGRLLVRPFLRLVARIRVTEVFTAAALLIVIATALALQAVGLSMSLGAFLAGVLLADSEFRHELEADIEPFKGLLLGLFFIAVGMSANLGLLMHSAGLVLAVTFGFIALKLMAIAALGRWTGHSMDSALRLGLSLAAGGEFAFVLFTLAASNRLIDPATGDLLVLAVTLSMMLGPLLLIGYEGARRRLFPEKPAEFDSMDDHEGRIIIAGFGRFGQIVGRVLRARRIPFTALDANQTHIDFIRSFGNRVYYGDVSRLDVLRAAGAEQASVLVLAIDDVDASVRTVEIVREHFPHLKLFVRARNRQHTFRLMELGVRDIVRETYAASLEMAETVLRSLGEPAEAARRAVKRFREFDQDTLRTQFAVKDDDSKLIAASRESARQLEALFAADEAERQERDAPVKAIGG